MLLTLIIVFLIVGVVLVTLGESMDDPATRRARKRYEEEARRRAIQRMEDDD